MLKKNNFTEENPTILSYVRDLPNLLSLAGLACSLLAIYFSILGVFYAAMIGIVWAVAFDWSDGLVARKMKGRTATDAKFGGQLDSMIDVVNFGVVPAVLLLSFGAFEPLYLFGAFLIVAAATLRLSYFNVYGLDGGTQYTGLALDNNGLILVAIFLLESVLSHSVFSLVLYTSIVSLAILNVSEIKTPKLSGNPRNVFLLGLYLIGMTIVYGSSLV